MSLIEWIICIILSIIVGIFIGLYIANLDYDAMCKTIEINNYLYTKVEELEKEIRELIENDKI